MKRLFPYMMKNIWLYIIAIVLLIFGIALDMLNPHITRIIIDDIILGKKLWLFQGVVLSLLGITLGRAIFGYVREFIFDVVGSKIVQQLRKDLFDHIQTLSFSYFDNMNTGTLMSRIKEDTEHILHVLAFGSMLMIEQGIYFIVASVLLFSINWKLALISLATMPWIAWIALKLEKKIGETYEKISDQSAVINTTAQENIAGVRLVKAFGREKYEIQKFLRQNKKNYKLNMEQADVWAQYHPKLEFLSNIVVVLVIAVGGIMVMQKQMSIGTLVAFSNYVFMLIWPMRMIGWLTNILAQCLASLKKIDGIFDEKPEIVSPPNPVAPVKAAGHIVFENVCFDYNGAQILKNLHLDIRPGSTVALMGATGSGKSSVINLIGRYYDCTSGKILVDHVNIKDMDIHILRSQISVVMQDTFLFSDTIAENIKFGSRNATDEEMIAAAKDAQIHDFILELPNGYDTVIGERGIGLSGGQKQRIAIARALLRNSSILILDDATSALDMETEYQVQRAIEKRKGLTKIIIAHRISAVRNADEILILENGEIVERGNHHTLLKLKGKYYNTYCEQFEGLLDLQREEVV